MSYSRVFVIFIIACFMYGCKEEISVKWNGKSCAVVLTYDDALDVHLDHVIPSLNTYNLKGTFYIIGSSDCFTQRNTVWAAAAKNGHELGNHTFMHPCASTFRRTLSGAPEKDLKNYTLKKVVEDIVLTNNLLFKTDGKAQRTFAFPCGDKEVNDTLFYNYVNAYFVGARGIKGAMEPVHDIKLNDVNAFVMHGHTGKEMIKLVDEAIENKELLVFIFHGVGGGSSLNVAIEAHEQLLAYLHVNQDEIWVAPMVDVAEFVKNTSQKN